MVVQCRYVGMAPTEVRKSILLIKSQGKSVLAVENFLKNREWKIHSTTGLKEALTYLVAHKPSFVMISVDHPNKKVRTLPKLLSEAFPVYVMVFSEVNSNTAYKNLLDSGCPYRINPPITGPAVERMINKILKDKEDEKNRAASPDAPAMPEGHPPQGPHARMPGQSIKGEAGGFSVSVKQGHTTVSSGPANTFDMNSAKNILRQIADSKEDEKEAEALNFDLGALPNEFAAPVLDAETLAGKGKDGSAGWTPSEIGPEGSITQEGNGPGEMMDATEEGRAAALKSAEQKGVNAPLMSTDQDGGPLGPGGYRPEQVGTDENGAPIFAQVGNAGGQVSALQAGKAGEQMSALQKSRAPGEMASDQDGGDVELRQNLHHLHHPSGRQKDESIMVRGTQTALDESVNHIVGKNGEPIQKVQDSSNVACLIVESARFSGYLVAALGKNRKMDEKFVDIIKDRLSKFLKDNGEPIKDGNSLSLKIKKVDFEDWALEYADFLKKSVHDGEEIAMAFFPFSAANTTLEESAAVDMGAVKMEELQGDIGVDFNLYIYLPTNKKYVLYTPRGSKFYGNQKGRLSGMGVTHMHVKKTELQDVSRYRAQNYLNSKISEFESKKRKGPGAA